MLEFFGQLTTPDRFSYHTGATATLRRNSYNKVAYARGRRLKTKMPRRKAGVERLSISLVYGVTTYLAQLCMLVRHGQLKRLIRIRFWPLKCTAIEECYT